MQKWLTLKFSNKSNNLIIFETRKEFFCLFNNKSRNISTSLRFPTNIYNITVLKVIGCPRVESKSNKRTFCSGTNDFLKTFMNNILVICIKFCNFIIHCRNSFFNAFLHYFFKMPITDPIKRREQVRQWKLRNKGKVKAQKRRWRSKNLEHRNEVNRQWSKRNPEKVKQIKKRYREKKRKQEMWRKRNEEMMKKGWWLKDIQIRRIELN